VIAGLEFPDSNPGTALLFDGKDVAASASAKRQIGFVFQHYALFKHMTVADNIAFGLRVKPRRERPPEAQIKARVDELLSLIQLAGFGNRYPSQLSGGQRQRVALARALAVTPRFLLLDEPFGALDAKVRQGLRTWLRQLHEELQMTTILVTHDQEEALEVADTVVIMNRGRIVQEGTPEEVFHRPVNHFVMDFLGRVNVFHGRMDGDQAQLLGNLGAPKPSQEQIPLFVRPHDLEVDRHPGDSALPATIQRIGQGGNFARIYVELPDGGHATAELPWSRFRELGLQRGEKVYLRAHAAQVFSSEGLPADYQI
jgi:sulfate transport system ATP-binding protein